MSFQVLLIFTSTRIALAARTYVMLARHVIPQANDEHTFLKQLRMIALARLDVFA